MDIDFSWKISMKKINQYLHTIVNVSCQQICGNAAACDYWVVYGKRPAM